MAGFENYRVISGVYAAAQHRRVFLSSSIAPPSAADLRALGTAQDALFTRLKEPFATLSVSSAAIALPDGETRRLFIQMMSEGAGRILAHANVLEGDGFVARAARTVGSGILLVAKSAAPYKVFATVDAAAPWVGSFLGWNAADIAALGEAARAFRQKHLFGR